MCGIFGLNISSESNISGKQISKILKQLALVSENRGKDSSGICFRNSVNKKINIILEKGIPFRTLLYLKGHIMIYIGEYQGKPLIFHNTWGIKTVDFFGNYGRNIIGKTVITTLEVGKEIDNFDEKLSLIN